MNYDLVIFDLDNTLLNFDKMELGGLSESLEKNNIEVNEALISAYIKINKKLWADLEKGEYSKAEILVLRFQKLFEKFNIKNNPAKVNEDYLRAMSDHIYMMDYAYEVLEHYKGKVALTMITNGVKSAQVSKMKKSDLNKYFTEVVISDEVGHNKPDIKIFEYLEMKIGKFDKDKTLIIGDSLTSDIQGGINFGIHTCWFNPKSDVNTLNSDINYEIRSLDELYKII